MRPATLRLLALCALLTSTLSVAAPAHWHWWQSKLDGRLFCSQASPGSGWDKQPRAFRDMHCKRPARAAQHPEMPGVEPGQPKLSLPGISPAQHLN